MRYVVALLFAFVSCVAGAAVPDGKSESYSAQLDKSNMEFLQQLVSRLEQRGLKHVHVIPQLFVVIVERDGKPTALVVDSDTLQTFDVNNEIAIEFMDGPNAGHSSEALPNFR